MGAIKKWQKIVQLELDHKPIFWEFVIYKSQIVLENRIYTIYEILPP